MPKFGAKIALFGYFFDRNLKKTIFLIEMSTLKFA